MADLKDFIADADAKSPFLKFEEGKVVKGVFISSEVVPDNYNQGQSTVKYTLELADGTQKSFTSKSTKLAKKLVKVQAGDLVSLTKDGEGFDTKWRVVVE